MSSSCSVESVACPLLLADGGVSALMSLTSSSCSGLLCSFSASSSLEASSSTF